MIWQFAWGVCPIPASLHASSGRFHAAFTHPPDYLVQNGNPGNPDELTDHECIGMRQDKPGHWHLYREESRISIRTSGRFQMNSIGMMRRFASMGAGIAILPDKIVGEDVADNKLTGYCLTGRLKRSRFML